MQIPVLVIVGPTGAGKTAAAIRVAQAVGGEVVTADSMQVYRGMDIGTAKPTRAERAGIPHHLLDLVAPDEAFSVGQYQAQADAVIADIHARGRVPILSGGTGFYIRAVLERPTYPPPTDPALRAALQLEAAQGTPEALHARLAAVDPLTAARLHPHDRQRVLRALEVFTQTGRSLSSFAPPATPAAGPYRPRQFGLTLSRATLMARLEARVHAQLAQGLEAEVAGLLAAGYSPALPAMHGITYRQLVAYFTGVTDRATAIAHMVIANRQYAKRQLTWFRADPRIHWLDLEALGGPAGAADRIIAALTGGC
jgi:tRNA dimethylallyltransferase